MAKPVKHSAELRDRAIRMVSDKLSADPSLTRYAACKQVSDQVGVKLETLRNWVNLAHTEPAQTPETTIADKQRIADLEKEVRELRQTNKLLWEFTANFAQRELDRN